MNKVKKGLSLVLAGVLTMSMLQGCGKGNEGNKAQTVEPEKINTEPVTLSMWTSMSDEMFKKLVQDPVSAKYPFITMTKVAVTNKIPDLITADQVPDIIADSITAIPTYEELKIAEDLNPYVKAHNVDLNKINPVVLDTVRKNSYNGKLSAIPVSTNAVTMYYNKDIFDRFAVSYPKDGMTWDEVYELAKKVSRSEGGVKYRGFDFQDLFLIPANQLSLTIVDNKTMKATVNNEGWKKLLENFSRFLRIPGNEVDSATYGKGGNQFLKDKTLAMYVSSSMFSSLPDAVKEGLNFDVVTLPSFADKPNTTTQAGDGARIITTTSKHKDQAFLSIMALLSEEAQSQIARTGNVPILVNSKASEDFAKDSDVMKDKNRMAFVKNKMAAPPASITKYDTSAYSTMRNQLKKMVLNNLDINTVLREAEELINQKIEQDTKK